MPFPTFRAPVPIDPDGPRVGPPVLRPVDLDGRTVVVLGGASWLGHRAAATWAARGARVFVIDGDPVALRDTVDDITGRTGALVTGVPFAVTDADTAHDAVAAISTHVEAVDVVLVVRNVIDGGNGSLAHSDPMRVNHIGPCAFVDAVEPLLGVDSRVVHVVTDAHFQSRPSQGADLDAVASSTSRGGDGLGAGLARYGLTGLLTIACALDRAERWAAHGITVNVVNPGGLVATVADRGSTTDRRLATWLARWRRPRQAVAAVDYVCTSPELDGVSGWYVKDRRPIRPSLIAQDPAFQVRARRWSVEQAATTR